MAYLRIDLDHPIRDGEMVTFKAPCSCNAVTGVIVYYPDATGDAQLNKTFAFRDSHNHDLTSLGNLFLEGVLVAAVLNTTDGTVQLLNADTNKYLENAIANAKTPVSSSLTSDSQTVAASSYAVKVAYELASKKTTASSGSVKASTLDGFNSPVLNYGEWSRAGDIVTVNIRTTFANVGSTAKTFGFKISGIPEPKGLTMIPIYTMTSANKVLNGSLDVASGAINLSGTSTIATTDVANISFTYIAE